MIHHLLIVSAALFLILGQAVSADDKRPPNLVIIMADDLGYADVSCFGNKKHATPNMDSLSAEGVRCTDFYVSSPVCTPTRVALLTGRHPVRVGFSTLLWPTSEGGLPNEELTLPEILKDHGYISGLIGKWHLGHHEERNLPLAHGFDYFYGMPYPNDMGPGHSMEKMRGESWPPMPMFKGNRMVEPSINVNLLTQQYTAEAAAFIAREHHRPFFLFLSHAMPHTIIGASPDFTGKSANGLYGDAVQELDWSVGEINRTLRTFGLEQNTLVIFTSDNGAVIREQYTGKPDDAKKMFPDMTFGTNAPFRGGKQSTFEGGVRVPTAIYWPGVIPAGQVQSLPLSVADVLPTFLDFANIPLSADRDYDGMSLESLLTQKGNGGVTPERRLYFGSGELTAMRSGDWKLVTPKQPPFLPGNGGKPMLFDLAEDPGETKDLAEEQHDRTAKLLAALEAMEGEMKKDQISRKASGK
jgi:arylsulfatase A